jgi:predicted O-linked N-acetylglucosamine transferase (SPINDLY family)
MKKQTSRSKYQSVSTQFPSLEEQNQLLALYNKGLFSEAVVKAEDLTTRFPKHSFAWKALGASLQSLGRLNESLEAKKISVELAPNDAEVHLNLGNAYLEQGKFNDAIVSLRRGLVIAPHLGDAHYNLALALEKIGNLKAAEESYLSALNLGNSHTAVSSNISLAELLVKKGDLEKAKIHYSEIIQKEPNFAQAYYLLGDIFIIEENWQKAEYYYRGALATNHPDLQANLSAVYSHLGIACRMQNKLREAEEAHRKAFGFASTNRKFFSEWFFIRCKLCEWNIDYSNSELVSCFENSQVEVMAPWSLCSIEKFTPQHLYQAGREYAELRYKKELALEPKSTKAISLHKKLRIGYLSADFYAHATVRLFIGILENRNSQQFDVYLYSYGIAYQDEERSRIETMCEQFRHVRELTDEAIASQILADEIDILIDLKGYTAGTRLGVTALRPAPVIVSWLGYPGTLGHERLADYIIGDATVTPFEHAEYYSEKLALMPHCYQPNDNKRPIGIVPTRLEVGLPENAMVFCTFNQAYKITPEMFDIWCRLLGAVPNSVLWLLEPHPAAQENLRREIELRGIESSRLIFALKMEQTAHLGRLQLADLAVDTFPCTSHTTASDALWAGVPLVTKKGETFASRVAASILNTMDLSELVTTNDEDYFHVALELAQNPEKLAAIKAKIQIQKQTSPLFDTQKFARDLERLYQTIWEQELKGERKAIIYLLKILLIFKRINWIKN